MSLRSLHSGAVLLLAALGLSGCASFSPDGGMTVVSDIAKQATNKDVAFVRSADDAARNKDRPTTATAQAEDSGY